MAKTTCPHQSQTNFHLWWINSKKFSPHSVFDKYQSKMAIILKQCIFDPMLWFEAIWPKYETRKSRQEKTFENQEKLILESGLWKKSDAAKNNWAFIRWMIKLLWSDLNLLCFYTVSYSTSYMVIFGIKIHQKSVNISLIIYCVTRHVSLHKSKWHKQQRHLLRSGNFNDESNSHPTRVIFRATKFRAF